MDEINLDGIHALLPRERMAPNARKLRDAYACVPGAAIFQTEFGYFCFEKWQKEGHMDSGLHDEWNLDEYTRNLFGFDEPGHCPLQGVGWDIAPFFPAFEEVTLEDRGTTELVQDKGGRKVLFFKGRREGFMPEYVDHPVKDMSSWQELCEWRLDVNDPLRYAHVEQTVSEAVTRAGQGYIIEYMVIGGYMYLRSLIGSMGLLYKFADEPKLIHACMRKWLELADAMAERYQKFLTIDELFIAEDICYNVGPLISPKMIREFLFPYYQQLIQNIKLRQIDKSRHLYFQIDSDGNSIPLIKLYGELGMDYLSPFEAASGCDVVAVGKEHAGLVMRGGIDKRVLAQSKDAIDRYLEKILPDMRKRGGYIPTCDHGVPEEVTFENYMHFRKKMQEYGG